MSYLYKRLLDAWADAIYHYFEPDYVNSSGQIIERVRYTSDTIDFNEILNKTEKIAREAVNQYGWTNVSIQLLSFDESINILASLRSYPTLYNLTWYGAEPTACNQHIMDDVSAEAEHVKLISATPASPLSEEYLSIANRYEMIFEEEFSYEKACFLDISMILIKAITESNSLDTACLECTPLRP